MSTVVGERNNVEDLEDGYNNCQRLRSVWSQKEGKLTACSIGSSPVYSCAQQVEVKTNNIPVSANVT